jgi:hypothetical protein
MAGKSNRTRVTLPGSLADLVKDLQERNVPEAAAAKAEQTVSQEEEQVADNQQQMVDDRVGEQTPAVASDAIEQQSVEAQDGSAVNAGTSDARANKIIGGERQREEGEEEGQRRGRPQKENTMKTYQIQKDDSADSWDLFLDLAKQYKTGGGRPATIYIDPTLKNILDRLKYPLSLTTSSILSSIVARFIYDHEEDVRKALFSQNIF